MDTMCRDKTVFQVDDEPGLRRIVVTLMQDFGCNVVYFETAGACLQAIEKSRKCDLVITDAYPSDMTGMEFLTRIREYRPMLPVLFVSYFGNIPLAVQAMKQGAIDFIRIEKPVDVSGLKSTFRKSLECSSFFSPRNHASLTATESKIVKLIADGKANSEIAYILQCSVRTVECHRSRIMHKLNVDNLASLVKKAILLNLTSIIGTQEVILPAGASDYPAD